MKGGYPNFVGLMIGLPMTGRALPPEWAFGFHQMSPPMNYHIQMARVIGWDVDKARNYLVEEALKQDCKYLFFLGEDVVAPSHTLRQLIFQMEHHPEAAVIGAIYCHKSTPPMPMVFRGNGAGPYWDWKVGEFFEVSGLGMDCTLIRVAVLKTLEKPWFKTVDDISQLLEGVNAMDQWTEDLFFCDRIVKAGWKVYAEGSLLCDHYDMTTLKPVRLPSNSLPTRRLDIAPSTKKIVDLGCGEAPLQTDEGEVVKVDIREEVSPDYRCDLRWLPFGTGEFDVVYCAVPGQRVLTPGGWCSIESVCVGDLVAGRGGFVRVLHNFTFQHSGDVFRLETAEGIVEVTGEHPIATPTGWVKAHKLREATQVFVCSSQVQPSQLVDDGEISQFVSGLASLGAFPATGVPIGDSPFAELDDEVSLSSLANKIGSYLLEYASRIHEIAVEYQPGRILCSSPRALVAVTQGALGSDMQALLYCSSSPNENPRVTVRHDDVNVKDIPNCKANGALAVEDSGKPRPVRTSWLHRVRRYHYVGPVINLETEDGTFFLEGVLTHNSSHTLEHFSRDEVDAVLTEWVRILKPEGELRLVVPNIAWAAERVLKGILDADDADSQKLDSEAWHTMNVLYGAQSFAENFHKTCFTPKVLERMLKARGFKRMDFTLEGYNIVCRAWRVLPEPKPVEEPVEVVSEAT